MWRFGMKPHAGQLNLPIYLASRPTGPHPFGRHRSLAVLFSEFPSLNRPQNPAAQQPWSVRRPTWSVRRPTAKVLLGSKTWWLLCAGAPLQGPRCDHGHHLLVSVDSLACALGPFRNSFRRRAMSPTEADPRQRPQEDLGSID